jgi:hypothetical protein
MAGHGSSSTASLIVKLRLPAQIPSLSKAPASATDLVESVSARLTSYFTKSQFAAALAIQKSKPADLSINGSPHLALYAVLLTCQRVLPTAPEEHTAASWSSKWQLSLH